MCSSDLGTWYTNAIIWAERNGVVDGYDNGKFGVDDSITREQMAAIFYRYASLKGHDVNARGNLSSFADADKISEYAKDAISWAVGVSLMEGDEGGLRPGGTATRAEVVAVLIRFADKYN